MNKIEISDANIYIAFNKATIFFSDKQLITEEARTNMVDLMVFVCNKYVGCNYIGMWDDEDSCLNYISAQLATRFAQNIKYITTMFSGNDFVNTSLPTLRGEKITKDAQNDTFTLAETAPINSPSVIPDIESGATGIDTPNNKNRGRYRGVSNDDHSIYSPEYFSEVLRLLHDYPTVADIAVMIFEPLVSEYMTWY